MRAQRSRKGEAADAEDMYECKQGLLASLELLPMWSGVDPEIELYASGKVLDDDGEWAGAQSIVGATTPGTCQPAWSALLLLLEPARTCFCHGEELTREQSVHDKVLVVCQPAGIIPEITDASARQPQRNQRLSRGPVT